MSEQFDVKSNEELFNNFKSLSLCIELLSGIVQNDQTISEDQLSEWNKISNELTTKLTTLIQRTREYVTNS